MPTKKKSHKKSHAAKSTHRPKRRKSAAKRTGMVQYNAAGSSPVSYVRGTRAVVGAMPSPESVKRAKEAAKKAAMETTHLLTSSAAAGALGYAEGQNMLGSIPSIGGLPPTAVVAGAAFVASKFMKSKSLDAIASGMLNIAVYNMAKSAGTTGDADSESWE